MEHGRGRLPRIRILQWLGQHRLLLAVTLIALAVRLVWNLKLHPPHDYVFSDMAGYVDRANRLLAAPLAKRVDEAFFPYGAHYLLAAVKAVFGKDNHVAGGVYQAAIGALTVTFMTAMARRLSGEGWAPRVVGLVGIFYYPLISLGGYYLSEPPYAFFVTASALLTLRLADEGRRRDAWLLGLTIGLAATVRPQILMSLPFLGVLWLFRRRPLRQVRPEHLVYAAIPLALVLAFSTARAYYHTGRVSLVAQNGAVNRVFGRCHNAKIEATRSWFGPPAIGELNGYGQRHPDAWIKLDPAMGLELKFKGAMWDEHILHRMADRCIQKTGWGKQAYYAVTHVVLLWSHHITWPDSGQPRFRPTMRDWNVASAVGILPGLVFALVLGFRRRYARHGLLGAHFLGLVVVSILYFGDSRYRVPYDPILLVLAIDAYFRAPRIARTCIRRLSHRFGAPASNAT